MKPERFVGFDFGTTNSSLAVADANGDVRIATFRTGNHSDTEAYRSVLYFEPPTRGPGARRARVLGGPSAISQYLQAEPKGRLIQSIKSFATSRSFAATAVFDRVYTFEELVAILVKRIVAEAEETLGPLGKAVTVGRPVRFVGADTADDEAFAVGRLRSALEMAGFQQIDFEYEPIGAAYFYDEQLDHDELVLIGDFGGGTSDFSLIRVGPSARKLHKREERILGNDGVGIAGDSFDASIIRRLVSPALGMGGEIRSGDKLLPVPTWVYLRLERWHHLSFLKDRDTLQMLRSVKAQALEPDRIAALLHLIDQDLGYQLHRSVQTTKLRLSDAPASEFLFEDGDWRIQAEVPRREFEEWIEGHVQAIATCVDGLLSRCGVDGKGIDKVFLTGGSSFVPAVRRVFTDRFGADKVAGGSEFTSVAKGLARRAKEAGG
ncbi:MAG: Hsp70 family protein [Bryobacterales bacterium]|nr:Hsp70 family protein [Bryobacterales bacterium]